MGHALQPRGNHDEHQHGKRILGAWAYGPQRLCEPAQRGGRRKHQQQMDRLEHRRAIAGPVGGEEQRERRDGQQPDDQKTATFTGPAPQADRTQCKPDEQRAFSRSPNQPDYSRRERRRIRAGEEVGELLSGHVVQQAARRTEVDLVKHALRIVFTAVIEGRMSRLAQRQVGESRREDQDGQGRRCEPGKRDRRPPMDRVKAERDHAGQEQR